MPGGEPVLIDGRALARSVSSSSLRSLSQGLIPPPIPASTLARRSSSSSFSSLPLECFEWMMTSYASKPSKRSSTNAPHGGCRRLRARLTVHNRLAAGRMSGTRRPRAEFGVWIRPVVTVALLAILLLFYLASDAFRGEVNRAVGVMGSGDTGALRDYILSYGVWALVVSAALMVCRPSPPSCRLFFSTSRTGWRSGASGAGC